MVHFARKVSAFSLVTVYYRKIYPSIRVMVYDII
nr:MAG TPA: hypothetical protein [Bacteriophage sp.]